MLEMVMKQFWIKLAASPQIFEPGESNGQGQWLKANSWA